jgi:hypothetical protein
MSLNGAWLFCAYFRTILLPIVSNLMVDFKGYLCPFRPPIDFPNFLPDQIAHFIDTLSPFIDFCS